MTKFLSVLAGLGLMDLSLQSLDSDNNVMFLFFSSNKAVTAVRLVLGAFIIFLAFRHRIKYRFAYRLSVAVAALLVAFPLAGMAYPQLTYSIYGVIKPLDYLVSLSFGLILAALVLEIEPASQRFSWRMPHLPKPHSPDLTHFILNGLLHSSPARSRQAKRARA